MLNGILYTTAWVGALYLIYALGKAFIEWLFKPHCPHCQCEKFDDDKAITPAHRNRLIVINRRFTCGYGVTPEGRATGNCRRLAYRRAA